ncbi:MAG: Gfo/Idh/MocA family oxidoreductase [Firmicutes bacterium]|nr:Gfo/Idh/MocA family oxidoreductase [Bacillota bacterium]
MAKTIRVGVIGCGMVFTTCHMPAFLDMHDVELVAFYDIFPERAQWIRDRYATLLEEKIAVLEAPFEEGQRWVDSWYWSEENTPAKLAKQHRETLKNMKVYDSAEELLDNVDVVTVCTPVRYHVYYSVMALERGVHVMSEKAMARTWWEARAIKEAVQKTGALYQLNDDNLFLPRYDTIRNIIESDQIGDVQSMWIARGGHGPEKRSWFWNPEISGGGSLMDYGCHAITSLWFLIGFDSVPAKIRSLRIESRMKTRPLDGRVQTVHVEDDAHFKIQFEQPNGNWCDAIIEATWSYPELGTKSSSVSSFIRVQGSEGQATGYTDEEGNDFIKVERYGFGEKLIPVYGSDDEIAYANEIKNFIECVRHNTTSIIDEEVGLRIMEVIGSAYLSELRDRQAVTPEEFRAFCEDLAAGAPDEETATLRIIKALMEPYKN